MYIQTIPNISYVDMSIPKNSKSSQCPELPLIRLVQPASAGDVGCQGPREFILPGSSGPKLISRKRVFSSMFKNHCINSIHKQDNN